jgi:hypothetical protein
MPTPLLWIIALLVSACATPLSSSEDAVAPGDADAAPSYEELFTTYFDKGTQGHCATSGCHADPGHNVWLCTNKDACYQGMVEVGLIDTTDPTRSDIADARRSPLTWINPAGGNMPLDAQGDNEAARQAIEAWVAAGAMND